MAEENTATGVQEASDATNPTLQASEPTTSTPSPADEGQKKPQRSAEDYERMIADLRKESAGYRTRLKALEAEEQKRAEAQMTKEQLLEKQYNDLKAQHEEFTQAQTERAIKHEVALEAAKLGVDPAYLDKVSRFLDWEEIEIDEQTGNPTNVRELVEHLVKEMPALKKSAPASSGGATNPSRSTSTAPAQLSWDVIGKMTPQEYNARRAEINEFIAKNPMRYGGMRPTF